MSFGLEWRRGLTGAAAYVLILQSCSLLPGLYILLAAGYMGIAAGENLFSVLFDLGLAALPRWEAGLLSLLYRTSGSEVAVFFALTGAALAFGLLAGRLLQGSPRAALWSRRVFAALIAADLALRLLPLGVNRAFPVWAGAAGFAVRAACLGLVLLDLRAEKKRTAEEE